MPRLVGVNRYRMVDLQSGMVVMVFTTYPGLRVLDSCQRACQELDIDPGVGTYRIDHLKQHTASGQLRWVKLYRFVLESE